MFSTLSVLLLAGAWTPLLAFDLPESCGLNTFYLELGCTPIYDKSSKCPVEYDCGNFQKFNPSMCYYNGKSYAKGAKLPKEEKIDPCFASCVCADSYPKTENAEWRCANVECFGDKYQEGCVNTYNNVQECCRKGTYCAGKDKEPSVKCTYKGKTYVKGEHIEDDQKCRKCVCDEHFTETLQGPNCRVQTCGHMLHSIRNARDGCVPVYWGKSHCSCPIEHKCPESSDTVAKSATDLDKSGRTCKFGDLTLKVGEKLVQKSSEKFECSCETPPHVTCIQTHH